MGAKGNGLGEATKSAPSPANARQLPRPGRPAAQVRGVMADRVVVSTSLDPFLSVRALASYAGLSVRKLRDLLDDASHPLPAYQVGSKLLVRRSEFDVWMAAHRRSARAVDNDRLIDEMLHGLSLDRRMRRQRTIRAGEG